MVWRWDHECLLADNNLKKFDEDFTLPMRDHSRDITSSNHDAPCTYNFDDDRVFAILDFTLSVGGQCCSLTRRFASLQLGQARMLIIHLSPLSSVFEACRLRVVIPRP